MSRKNNNSFKDGRKGYVHIIRDILKDIHPSDVFTYHNIFTCLQKIHPERPIKRTTIIATLINMADVREIEVVEKEEVDGIGLGCTAKIYRRIA